MNWKSFSFVFLAIFGIVLATIPADGALNAYMSVKGEKQGAILGSVTQKGREGKIAIIAVSHEIVSPRDAATGQATGKILHKPYTVTIEWDRAMPGLIRALTTNENLPEVVIDFWQPTLVAVGRAGGQEINYLTVKLTNAKIASIRSEMLNNKYPENMKMREQLHVSFVYQKIEFNNKQGGGIAVDDWIGLEASAEAKPLLLEAAGL